MVNDRWWNTTDSDVHAKVWAAYESLKDQQSERIQAHQDQLRLYGNLDLTTSSFAKNSYAVNPPTVTQSVSKYNVIKTNIDAVTNRISKNKPRPKVVPNGGDWQTENRSRLLSDFILGQIQTLDLYKRSRSVFRDGGIFGTSGFKFGIEKGKIYAEKALALELFVDDIDGLYGDPRQLLQVKAISKDVLKEKYPSAAEELDAASYISNYIVQELSGEFADVIEAWYLPCGDEPGRHIICTSNLTLLDEPWTKKRFPFVFWKWQERPLGFFGQGIAEQLDSIQLEINTLLYKVQENLKLHSSPIWWLPNDAQIPEQFVTNMIGRYIKSNKPPTLYSFPIMPQEVYSYLETLIRRASMLVGVSEMSTYSKKPSGLSSGRALEEWNDIESGRFANIGQDWEDFFKEIADHLIDLGQDIYEKDKGYSVSSRTKDRFTEIKWKDARIDFNNSRIEVFPVNLLPDKPEGRLQRIEQLIQMGSIELEDAFELLDIPDLKRYSDVKYAPRRLIKKQLEDMLEEGPTAYAPPETTDDLGFALKYAQQLLALGKLKGYPDEHLDTIRAYISNVTDIIEGIKEQQLAEQQAQQANQTPQPQGA